MTDLAKIGFSADTSGLAKTKTAFDSTRDAAKTLNDELSKTKPAATEAASGLNQAAQAADQLSARTSSMSRGLEAVPEGSLKAAQAANTMATALVAAAAQSGKYQNAAQQLEQIVTKTGASYTQAAAALQAATAAHRAAGEATSSHAGAVDRLAGAAGGAVPPIAGLGEAAAAAGGGVGILGASGLRAGLEVLSFASAIGLASVNIVKAGDEVERTKSRMAGVTGNALEGAKAFNQIKQSANASGAEFYSLASAIEKASQGQDKMNKSWPIIEVSSNKVTAAIGGLSSMFETLDKVMQTSGATAKEEAAVQDTLASGIQKTGGLTVGTFQQIRDLMPQVARTIANAFGQPDLDKFQQQLERTPIPLRQLETQINRIKPAIDAALDTGAPKTFEQATRGVKTEWQNLLETLANTGAFGGVIDVLKTISGILKQDAADVVAFVNAIKSLPGMASNMLSNTRIGGTEGAALAASDYGGAGLGGSNVDTGTASIGGSSFGFDNSDYINSGTFSYLTGDSNFVGNFASGGSFVVPGSGGTDSFAASMNLTPGEIVDIHPPGALTGAGGSDTSDVSLQTAVLSQRIDDARDSIVKSVTSLEDTIKTAGSSTNSLSAAATSTSTTAPSSSTTSGATSWSRAIGTSVGGASLGKSDGEFGSPWSLHDDSPGSRRAQQQQQYVGPQLAGSGDDSGVISGEGRTIKGYKGSFPEGLPLAPDGKSITPSVPAPSNSGPAEWPFQATGTPGSFGLQSTPISAFGTAGGVMGALGASNPILVPGAAADNQPSPTNRNAITEFNSAWGSLRDSFDSGNKSLETAIKDSTDAAKTIGANTDSSLDSATQSLAGVKDASDRSVQGIGATRDAVAAGSGDIVSALQSVGSSIAGAVSSAVSSVGAAAAASAQTTSGGFGGGSGSGDGYDGSGGYDAGYYDDGVNGSVVDGVGATIGGSGNGGSVFDTGTSSFNDYVSNPGSFPDFGQGGSSVIDVATQYMGGYATGGQFTVGGDGGTDTTPVGFHATRGETVTITPPGLPPPPSPGGSSLGRNGDYGSFATGGQFTVTPAMSPSAPTMPAWMADSAAMAAYGSGGVAGGAGGERNINIYLESPHQAESIIRSRAQIARALRG